MHSQDQFAPGSMTLLLITMAIVAAFADTNHLLNKSFRKKHTLVYTYFGQHSRPKSPTSVDAQKREINTYVHTHQASGAACRSGCALEFKCWLSPLGVAGLSPGHDKL